MVGHAREMSIIAIFFLSSFLLSFFIHSFFIPSFFIALFVSPQMMQNKGSLSSSSDCGRSEPSSKQLTE
jgi:hypothetical protein